MHPGHTSCVRAAGAVCVVYQIASHVQRSTFTPSSLLHTVHTFTLSAQQHSSTAAARCSLSSLTLFFGSHCVVLCCYLSTAYYGECRVSCV